MTLNDYFALSLKIHAFFGAHHKNLNEDRVIDLHCQQRRCSPVTLISGNIRFMQIFVGSLGSGEGVSNDSGVVKNGNFQYFCSLLLQKL